jgi:hypothetical protein
MGATIWVEVDDGIAEPSPDNSILLKLEEPLAALCARSTDTGVGCDMAQVLP